MKNLSRSRKNLPKSRKIYQGQGKAIMIKKNLPKPREPHKVQRKIQRTQVTTKTNTVTIRHTGKITADD